jgi:hypothetical protein
MLPGVTTFGFEPKLSRESLSLLLSGDSRSGGREKGAMNVATAALKGAGGISIRSRLRMAQLLASCRFTPDWHAVSAAAQTAGR